MDKKLTRDSVSSNTSNISSLQTSVNGKAAKGDSIKSIGRSGTTFTATRADGTTFTFTQQDNNTTYSASTSYGVTMSGTEIRRYSNVLYNNTSGTTGDVTLSSSSANYNHMTIYFRSNDSDYGSVDIYSPNGKRAFLCAGVMADANVFYVKIRNVLISGNKISTISGGYGEKRFNQTTLSSDANNNIYIIRVEAWNE